MSPPNNPPVQPAKPGGSRFGNLVAALAYSDFRVLWASTISNQLGQGMQQVLLGFLVFDMTGSGGMVGAVFAMRSAPNLLVGLAAGSVTDRLDRRTVMRFSVIGMAAASSALAFLLLTERQAIWNIMAITFLLGTLQSE